MDELKETIRAWLLSAPAWFLGFGVAALMGVWWWRMNATTSNITTVLGVVAITVAVFLSPYVAKEPMAARLAWSVLASVSLGLFSYYVLWHPLQAGEPPQSGIRVKIQQLMCGLSEDRTPMVALIVRAANSGEPSIAEGWSLRIKAGDREVMTFRDLIQGQDTTDFVHPDGKVVSYPPEDSLSEKTIRQPIPTGGSATGVLIFRVRDLTYEELCEVPFHNYLLTCRDVHGMEILATQNLGATEEDFVYPGTSPGFSLRNPGDLPIQLPPKKSPPE